MNRIVGYKEVTADGLAGVDVWHGYFIRETAGFAARVEIRDGSATGTILGAWDLAANEEVPIEVWDTGIATAGGIWVEIASGAAAVVVYGV